MATKSERQKELLRIAGSGDATTQSELVKRLRLAGFRCTQASVSRDVKELRLVKRQGRYAAPDDWADGDDWRMDLGELAQTVNGFIQGAKAVGDNLIVIKTLAGTADSVALLLDRIEWDGLVGTVAGDDTIFTAVSGRTAGKRILGKIHKLMEE